MFLQIQAHPVLNKPETSHLDPKFLPINKLLPLFLLLKTTNVVKELLTPVSASSPAHPCFLAFALASCSLTEAPGYPPSSSPILLPLSLPTAPPRGVGPVILSFPLWAWLFLRNVPFHLISPQHTCLSFLLGPDGSQITILGPDFLELNLQLPQSLLRLSVARMVVLASPRALLLHPGVIVSFSPAATLYAGKACPWLYL